jgi:hypothetical protein
MPKGSGNSTLVPRCLPIDTVLLSSDFPDIGLIFPFRVCTDPACVFRVKFLSSYVVDSFPGFVLSDLLARIALFSR